MKNPHIYFESGKAKVVDMPEKPKTCNEINISCCETKGDCEELCSLFIHDTTGYNLAVKEAIANAVEFEEDWEDPKCCIPYFSDGGIEGKFYPIPDGYRVEVSDVIQRRWETKWHSLPDKKDAKDPNGKYFLC